MISRKWTVSWLVMLLGFAAGWLGACAQAAESPNEPSYEPDPFVGLYTGTLTDDTGSTVPARAFVYTQGAWLSGGRDVYYARLERKDEEANWKAIRTVTLTLSDRLLAFPDEAGSVDGKTLACHDKSGQYELKRTEIPSPTLGEKPPEGAVVLLPFEPGKAPSLEAWDNPTWRALDDGSMEVGKGDNRTRKDFFPWRWHIEFMLPVEPGGQGQNRANSGIYISDRYEVQVLDSFGLAPEKNTCGAIYGVYAPIVNAARPAGQWQAYDIYGYQEKNGMRFVIEFNGVEISSGWSAIYHPTAGGTKGPYSLEGPLRLQDHGHPVRYRNIWVD